MPTKIHWLTWQPTPYNDYLFRSLAAHRDIELTVHFVAPILDTHPWRSQMAQGFHSRICKPIRGLDPHLLSLLLREKESFFIIGGWSPATMFLSVNALMVFGRNFAVWSDTPELNRRRTPVKRWLRHLWLQRVFARSKYIMGTGKPAVAALAQMGCPREKLVNFPFVVDLDRFHLESGRLDPKPIVLLSSGRLVNSHKGYDVALRALALAREETGVNDFKYRIAGTGPDQASLQALAAELGLSAHVEFLGWLEPDELPAFYHSGDLFVHSSHFDPYPNAVLEAMASGLPVIGSDQAGSVLDRVQETKSGFVHRDGDVKDLAAKISYAFLNQDMLSPMGLEARRSAEEWTSENAATCIRRMCTTT